MSVANGMEIAGREGSFWTRSPQSLRIGTIILIVHGIVAAIGPFLAPYGYAEMGTGLPMSGMDWAHPFGVDLLGRDVFSRVIFGAHLVILLSISGTALGLMLGSVVGLMAGYIGGWLDNVVQRLLEAFISIPLLILALLAITAAGPEASGSSLLLVLVVALVYAPRIARMARSVAVEIKTRDFIIAAKLRGEGAWSVVRHEMLPNATSVLLVEFALRAGYAPVLIGSLGFLGFGMRPPTPEWGLMISENRALLLTTPVAVLGPGLALASLVVGLNMFTEGIARILGRTVRLSVR